ncbi:TPA: hypothetical protein ACNH4I_003203 [Serratia marcescens]
MSTEKLSELSKPVGFVSKQAQALLNSGDTASIRPFFDVQGSSPLYSQEYVSALQHESAVNWEAAASLNVENHDLKKRIAELERANQSQDDHINQQQDRIDSLEKTSAGLGRRLGDTEKRLATPVRLPLLYSPDPWMSPDPDGTWLDKEDVKKSIRAAGFTVEEDE